MLDYGTGVCALGAVRCHFGVGDPLIHFINKYPDKIRVNVALSVKICVIHCDPFFEKCLAGMAVS